MAVTFLTTHRVEKPWGRHDLSPLFDDQPRDRPAIGEIWFEDDRPRELLIKYLFTSERLSVQVHPDDSAAQARGHARGKDEAWIVLSAEPHSTIALGLKEPAEAETVRAAALNGSIEAMLYWKPVSAGDVIYSPAGTIHAIGAGLRLIEIQQNLDLTFRFYDYGSDRELHLDEAMEVAIFGPFEGNPPPRELSPGRSIVAENGRFITERWKLEGAFTLAPEDSTIWLLPVEGHVRIEGADAKIGDAIIIEGAADIEFAPGSLAYIAYPGSRVISGILNPLSRSTSLKR